MIVAVGIGPGASAALTAEAAAALRRADVVVGYRPYIGMIEEILGPDTVVEASGMRQEVERCRRALELHREGKAVAVVSSGDAGVYGMAGLLMELDPQAPVEVVPGITAAQAAAARLGAPLMNDFVVLSLSDLLTPRAEVLRRVRAAAAADLVTCLYNPTSRRRRPLFEEVVGLFLGERPAETPVGWVRNAYRPDEEVHVTDLGSLAGEPIDMWSVVIIGSSRTEVLGGRLVTRRGYADRYDVESPSPAAGPSPGTTPAPEESAETAAAAPAPARTAAGGPGAVEAPVPAGGPVTSASVHGERRLYMLGGTSFARNLAVDLEEAGYRVRLSVATSLGAGEVEREPSGGIHVGRLGSPGLAGEIAGWGAGALLDATHPYAVEASRTAEKAAVAAGVPLLRAVRAAWVPDGEDRVRFFDTAAELTAALLAGGHRAFFTVGAKGLQEFAGSGLRLAARVLPTPDSVAAALAAGVASEDLIAAYPPFDELFTRACLQRLGCDVIVTKESGREGGLEEKLAAARAAGAELFVLGRPLEARPVHHTTESILEALEGTWARS
ncbi:MAG: precorrin-3B C(17)-methyltransferase [Thermoleophilia bacterium]